MYSLKLPLILLTISTIYATMDITPTLKLLQIVHRNGDSTPIDFYPNDPFKYSDKWVDGLGQLGQLTQTGQQRMYRFGEKLRERYQNYLGNTLKNIYVRSSSSNRCVESAAALVAGMYSPQNSGFEPNKISNQWQPIAIQTHLKSSDGLLVTDSNCPAADDEYEVIMRSKEVEDFMESNEEFIKKVGDKTGVNYTKLKELSDLYDTLDTEMNFDEQLSPKWLFDIGNNTLQILKQFQLKAFQFHWSSNKIKRLRAGLILKELTQNMANASHSDRRLSMKKVYSYSTDDTLIVAILQVLGKYTGIPPSYGSALLFEFHENSDNKSFVQLFYANVTQMTLQIYPINLTICGFNQTDCQLNNLIDSVKEFIPEDWFAECHLINETSCKNKDILIEIAQASIGFGVGVVTVLIIGLIAYFIKKKIKRKQYFANSNSVNNTFIHHLK